MTELKVSAALVQSGFVGSMASGLVASVSPATAAWVVFELVEVVGSVAYEAAGCSEFGPPTASVLDSRYSHHGS